MVYRKPHSSCTENNCQSYSAYIRVQKKWIKAGEYNSKCRTFTANEDVKTYEDIKKAEFVKLVEDKREFLEKLIGINGKV